MKIILTVLFITSSAFASNNNVSFSSFSELNKTLNILSDNLKGQASFEYLENKKARKELKYIRCEFKKTLADNALLYFVNLVYNASMLLPDQVYKTIDFDKTNLEFEDLLSNKKIKFCYFVGPTFDETEFLYVKSSDIEFSIKFSEIEYNN